MEKQNLLTVKKFAKLTGVKESSLRYYDKLKLFSPAVRKDNGYRYYLAPQMIILKAVLLMEKLGVPLRQISKLYQSRTPEVMVDLMTQKESELNLELARLQRALISINSFRTMAQTGLAADTDKLQVQYMDAMPYILGPKCDYSASNSFYPAILDLCKQAEDFHIDLHLPIGAMSLDMDAYLAAPSQPQHLFSPDPAGVEMRPAGKYLVAYIWGDYGTSAGMAEKMVAYMEENKLKPKGSVFTSYLFNELCTEDPNKYLAQVSVMVE